MRFIDSYNKVYLISNLDDIENNIIILKRITLELDKNYLINYYNNSDNIYNIIIDQ